LIAFYHLGLIQPPSTPLPPPPAKKPNIECVCAVIVCSEPAFPPSGCCFMCVAQEKKCVYVIDAPSCLDDDLFLSFVGVVTPTSLQYHQPNV